MPNASNATATTANVVMPRVFSVVVIVSVVVINR